MNAIKTKNIKDDFSIQKKLESAKDLIRRKQHKNAIELLLQIDQVDKNNKEVRELLTQLEKRRRIRNFRIAMVSIFIATTISIAFLGWKKMSSTEVAIHLTANELSFTIDKNWTIYSIKTKSLGISHLEDFVLNPIRVEKAVEYDPDTNEPSKWQEIDLQGELQIKHTDNDWKVSIESNYLKLSRLDISAGSTVKISMDEQIANRTHLTITNGTVFGTVETGNILMLTCNNCQIKNQLIRDNLSFDFLRIFTQSREIEFRSLNKSIDIILENPPNKQRNSTPNLFAKSININEIDFTRFEGNERESTITQEGKIFFAELDGKEFDIKAGDFILIDEMEDFQVKRLYLNNQIIISLYGKVKKLKSGTDKFLYSRIPTYLEWLHTNHSITIFLGTLIPVFSTILAIFYRLKSIKEI